MARTILASVHVSSIYPPSNATVIPVDTVRQDIPPPEVDPDVLQEHASFASTFLSSETGTIFIRIVHGGHILELTTLSTGRTVRFAFPAPILPAPAILLHQLSEVYVFAVTTSGTLFTLIFPVSAEENIPVFDVAPGTGWCKEYTINTPMEDFEGPVHVKDIDCVVVGLSKGRFLRLDLGQDYGINYCGYINFLAYLVYLNLNQARGMKVFIVSRRHGRPTSYLGLKILKSSRLLHTLLPQTLRLSSLCLETIPYELGIKALAWRHIISKISRALRLRLCAARHPVMNKNPLKA